MAYGAKSREKFDRLLSKVDKMVLKDEESVESFRDQNDKEAFRISENSFCDDNLAVSRP